MVTGLRAKNATANNEHENTSSMVWKGIHDQDLLTDVGGVVAAGDGEVDDVLVGGGKQGDKEEAEDKQDPPEAGTGSVPHFGTKFTKQA